MQILGKQSGNNLNQRIFKSNFLKPLKSQDSPFFGFMKTLNVVIATSSENFYCVSLTSFLHTFTKVTTEYDLLIYLE